MTISHSLKYFSKSSNFSKKDNLKISQQIHLPLFKYNRKNRSTVTEVQKSTSYRKIYCNV